MGNVLSTDAYPLFSWHPLLLWVKLVASAYFASLSLRQIVCLYHAHCARDNQRYMRAAHAWAHFISELHYRAFWREVERYSP